MRNVNMVNLETAFWVARLGSFTAAAERLYTTQPAISARMRELEAALGVKLFVRIGRGVETTLEGRNFLRQAEPLLQQLEALSASFTSGSGASGTVRIGTGNICMSWFPAMINTLSSAMPQLTYDIEVDRAAQLLSRLDARKLDLVLASGPIDTDKYAVRGLGYDQMLWVMSPSLLPLVARQTLTAFLKQIPMWCVQRDSFYWSDALRTVVDQGADPRHFNAVSNMPATHQMIIGACGIGLLSETMIRDDLACGRLVPIPGLRQHGWVELSVVCHKDALSSRVVTQIMDTAQSSSTFTRQIPTV